ncbi:hypothetical protein DFQ28_008316 [Apophysomyces sp. BC1034]|nr:hypothetical protein DFQ30_008005 [Apophysomyces sp. BC1015]KAG0175752.1 hypothetical protein DFQ29_007065 [Apophysomyces sp. BC1021]KAG0186113.1 hypothetical protein DFQ28_008316 [Apophysomyces sp. BC1034]
MSIQPPQELHKGVRKVQLFKKVWTKVNKNVIFGGLVMISWVSTWDANINATVTPTVTSLLQANNIASILSTVMHILQVCLIPLYSKVSDFTGRAETYTFALVLYMVSFVVMATTNNYDTLVGGRVVYGVGKSGCSILAPILIGDMTSVITRGLMQALYNIPALFGILVAPKVGGVLLDNGLWRWAYGITPILLLATGTPLICSLWHVEFKVRRILKSEQLSEKTTQEKKSFCQQVLWVITEIDLIGTILLVAGLCLILLPCVLANTRWGGWGSAITIGTLVSGLVSWILFALWEWKGAIKPLIPVIHWESRTPIWGTLATITLHMIGTANWQYFLTYLQVSRKASPEKATYLERGYSVLYIIIQPLVGYLMKRTRVWRPFIWVGTALLLIGVGLMIPARLPTSSDAFVVISQAIAGLGSGMLDVPLLVAVQSSVPHNDLSIVTALQQMGGSLGSAIGSTLAGAIWNAMLPGQIEKYVPGEYDYKKIVQSIEYAINLPDEQYNAVVVAYGEVQRVISIIAVCVASLTFFFSLPMRSFGLDESEEDRIKANAGSTTATKNHEGDSTKYDLTSLEASHKSNI